MIFPVQRLNGRQKIFRSKAREGSGDGSRAGGREHPKFVRGAQFNKRSTFTVSMICSQVVRVPPAPWHDCVAAGQSEKETELPRLSAAGAIASILVASTLIPVTSLGPLFPLTPPLHSPTRMPGSSLSRRPLHFQSAVLRGHHLSLDRPVSIPRLLGAAELLQKN